MTETGERTLLIVDDDAPLRNRLARAMEHAKTHGITVVVITQKPSLLSSVDKVMLLTDGVVGMFGIRDKVLKALAERGKKTGVPSPDAAQGGRQP